jgi:DNA mismatch repair ATPase MutS
VADYEKTIALYANRIEQYQQLPLSSPKMLELREKNFGSKSDLIMSLRALEKIQKRMSYRMNLLVGTILNMCLAWDFRVICQWEEWRQKYQSQLPEVEGHLTEMEVWISGAIYHYNFPETTFAHFNETNEVDISGLGHPFIPSEKRILNDVKYAKNEQFYIITGPNMAGKSTFLRSIGWALISANAGFPIMAKNCSMPRMKLYTSMRNTDDLKEESSYFYAELVRLRFIVDAIESGEKIFVILDEILKGTNSKDKELGSAGLMRKLANLHARGIIATHDLSLCNLANENKAFSNYYFDSTIDKDELHFDYLLRQGTCKNMNASFLLQKMRLVD